jgi:dTMP kinase
MKGRGALLVFEGVDRCGKTTQTMRLVNSLLQRSIPAELVRFPDRSTSTGKIIDAYLKNGVELDDKAVHLLFASNRWEAAASMREKLESGITLVVDRYSYSGVCFTGAKEGQSVEWCRAPEIGLPAPDAVFFLRLPIEEAMKRGEFGAERYEKEDFQRKVLKNFESMQTDKWRMLDASRSIEELGEEIQEAALDVIKQNADPEIGVMWEDS